MVIINVLLVVPLTVEAFFNAKYLAIIEQGETHILEKMDQIKTELDIAHAVISNLIAEREQEVALQKQIDDLLKISDAVRAYNNTDGRYFLALINTMRAQVNSLITDATQSEEIALASQLQQRIHHDEFDEDNDLGFLNLSKIIIDPILHAASWVSSTIRSFTPKFIQNVVDGTMLKYVPSTDDGESRCLLMALVTARLKNLNTKLRTANENIDHIANSLADNNFLIKPLILATPQTKLKHMLTTNQTVYQVITEYQNFAIQILNHQANLQLDKEIDTFLLAHDGFFVWLSLLLSKKISSLFKTKTSAKVEEIRALKHELQALKIAYDMTLATEKAEIDANPNISPEIKKAFVAKLTPNTMDEAPRPKALMPDTIVTKFNLIQTMFKNLPPAKQKPPAEHVVTMAAS